MKLTRSTSYAIAALCYIACNAGNHSVPAKKIAAYYHIPLEYLLKVLQKLVKGGLLIGVRGPHGGYTLTRPSDKISLAEIVESVEGPVNAETATLPDKIDGVIAAQLAKVYRRVAKQVVRTMSEVTLSNLIAGSDKSTK